MKSLNIINWQKRKRMSLFIKLTWYPSNFVCILSVITFSSFWVCFSLPREKQCKKFLEGRLEICQSRMALNMVTLCTIGCTSILESNILFSLVRFMQTGGWCFLHLQKLMLFHIISFNQKIKGRWSQLLPFSCILFVSLNLQFFL